MRFASSAFQYKERWQKGKSGANTRQQTPANSKVHCYASNALLEKKDQPTKYNTNTSKSYLLKLLNKTSHPIAAPAAKKTPHYTAVSKTSKPVYCN